MAAVVATEQGQEAGMLESVGVQPVRLTPSVVLAALESLGQGWAGLRAQGLEGVGQGRGPGESVGCSRLPLSGLLAWALAAASCEKNNTGVDRKKKEPRKERRHYVK